MVPKIGSCEHIDNDLSTHGSIIWINRWKQNILYFHPTFFLKDERRRQTLHIPVIVLAPNWRFFVSSEIGSCEYTTNDLPTFSPQKRNLEVGPSEFLLPIFGTKDRIFKIGSCERAFRTISETVTLTYRVSQKCEHVWKRVARKWSQVNQQIPGDFATKVKQINSQSDLIWM